MKTVEIKVYSFDELSNEAKEMAINEYRNSGFSDAIFDYDEAHKSVKKFNEIFSIRNNTNSWLDFSYCNLDDAILELKGIRLMKYIVNNFDNYLFIPTYIKMYNKHFNHKRAKNKTYKNGTKASFFYSNLKKTNSCVLTGCCWDDDLLQPIYNFLLNPCKYTTLNDLFKDCFNSLKKSLQANEEYCNSDEYISEQLDANEYYFHKDGTKANY